MTVRDWLSQAADRLSASGIASPRLEAQILMAHCLHVDRDRLLLLDEQDAPHDADVLLKRRLAGEPLAYILGWKEFYRRRFEVNPSVLIPRPETETLVEAVIELAPPEALCVDVGTGSGCIGVTCALERSDTRWILTDVSREALHVAQRNACHHAVACWFLQADLLSGFRPKSVDVIACNPPYVAVADPRLDPSVRKFEPAVALFAGETGLEHLSRLAAQAAEVLKSGGWLLMEVGEGQAAQVLSLCEKARACTVRKDLAGIERVVIAAY
ncbi:MAG: release factor glutamine methyltransferase [Fimbriimonadales bacterium]|nr:MAG: release factor glutamine methyltransferase [Fimbriimonadales bacterium]